MKTKGPPSDFAVEAKDAPGKTADETTEAINKTASKTLYFLKTNLLICSSERLIATTMRFVSPMDYRNIDFRIIHRRESVVKL